MELLREEKLQGFLLRTLSVQHSKVSPHLLCQVSGKCMLDGSSCLLMMVLNAYWMVLLLQSSNAHEVTQFHITNWAPDGSCSNLKTVTDVIEEVSKVQRRTGNQPIVMHCR